ncbi:MAG: MarR family winged helix-turn-helix transcriptional regulator [Candidatus Devosia phytovorans]|uniref:MarR family winged helix-turn-helix transcriptional regulator n=1 Tax=Candidatus Devosia phytovorans TaxID=3121372 RepID=A0AAJ6B3A4_9HYPH|nr:MarR family winged helix-turn-helix transcriptional regulator [Devosia sp.]WEK06203.1 MAG: MarR family winged helix-turn-helix transcriptional regulator [Devosia sp.]
MHKPVQAEESVGYIIHEVAKAFRRRFEEEVKVHDLTLPQMRALGELVRQGGVSQTVLGAAIDADPMTIKGILDRLEKRDLVTRQQDPSDSRAKILHVTPAGEALFLAAKAVGRGIQNEAMAGLSDADLKAVTDGLLQIRNNLTRAAAPPKDDL